MSKKSISKPFIYIGDLSRILNTLVDGSIEKGIVQGLYNDSRIAPCYCLLPNKVWNHDGSYKYVIWSNSLNSIIEVPAQYVHEG